jgi:hypothetical protein
MQRPRIALLLILALVLGSVAPVTAAWSCPDGSRCVPDRQSFRCEKDAPQAASVLPDCCIRKETARCHHGLFPGMGTPATPQPILQAPDHCRFSLTAGAELPALGAVAAYRLPAPDGLLPEALALASPVVTPSPYPPGIVPIHGPPLWRRTGPARAPPTP